MQDRRPADRESDEPATLDGAMRDAIGEGLKARYQVSRQVPHALLVLLMQINDKRRKERPAKEGPAKERPRRNSAAFRSRSSAHV
jgi:hypothetical protein